ncbi:Hsp70 family protein [Dactylosporangium sp. CA-233914]|uniref:Hsp70 family protein n=1 Tax=Dactylosporangium sp. CA-233914 TaxID=3239934 RepID=UPI003D8EE95A
MPATGVRLGIDFGTSHTVAVLRWPDGRVRPLVFDGSPLLPSAVCHDPGGGLLVGRDAIDSARLVPANFEPNPKRRIDEGEVLLGDQGYPIRDLFTAVLARVRAEATRTVGDVPAEVIVTYPANWGATRRLTLTDAALGAGLPEPRMVPEPVSAATYFVTALNHEVPVGSAVVVYDLGAGTFDASVVRRTPGGFDVLAVDGRDNLGGLDFDQLVIDIISRSVPPGERGRLLDPSTVEQWRLARAVRDEARSAKERLSRTASVTVPIGSVEVLIAREEFEPAARNLIDQTVRLTAELVRFTKLTPGQLAGVFLVGGASRMPLVATLLHRAFGQPPIVIEQPEIVVAEGSVYLPEQSLPTVGPVEEPVRAERESATPPVPAAPAAAMSTASEPATVPMSAEPKMPAVVQVGAAITLVSGMLLLVAAAFTGLLTDPQPTGIATAVLAGLIGLLLIAIGRRIGTGGGGANLPAMGIIVCGVIASALLGEVTWILILTLLVALTLFSTPQARAWIRARSR